MTMIPFGMARPAVVQLIRITGRCDFALRKSFLLLNVGRKELLRSSRSTGSRSSLVRQVDSRHLDNALASSSPHSFAPLSAGRDCIRACIPDERPASKDERRRMSLAWTSSHSPSGSVSTSAASSPHNRVVQQDSLHPIGQRISLCMRFQAVFPAQRKWQNSRSEPRLAPSAILLGILIAARFI